MIIERVESDENLKKVLEDEFERHETKAGVAYNFTPFCFVAKENDVIIGAITII